MPTLHWIQVTLSKSMVNIGIICLKIVIELKGVKSKLNAISLFYYLLDSEM